MNSVNREVCNQVTDGFMSQYPPERVTSLLGYGSAVDGRSAPSDIDIYLLLDTWNESDTTLARAATLAIRPYPVDLALHYKDEIPEDPRRFRLGKKSCLALAYLASAEVLHGDNPLVDMFNALPETTLRTSALHSIFYYLSLMRRQMATQEDPGRLTHDMDKYLARTIIDAMLFYKKTTYEPFRHMSNAEIIELGSQHPLIGRAFIGGYSSESLQSKLSVMQRLHAQVRLTNWSISRHAELGMSQDIIISNPHDRP